MSRLRGAFGLVKNSGQSATQLSNRPPCFKYSMKNGNCPSGVTGAVVSHSMREVLSTLLGQLGVVLSGRIGGLGCDGNSSERSPFG